MILLHSCSLLWFALDQRGLSDRAKESIQEHSGGLYVSAISAFEIGRKAASGRLKLKLRPAVWFPRGCELHGLDGLPLTTEAALNASALPLLHKDPFDRLLIATAMIQGIAMLTPDEKIRQYPKL